MLLNLVHIRFLPKTGGKKGYNIIFFLMYPFNLFKIHSHEVSFVFGSAGSCRGVYTHSDCDYGPSKVMPYMYLWVKSTVGLRQGRLISLPLEVHGFTLSTFNTWVELPDRYAKHPKDAPLLV